MAQLDDLRGPLMANRAARLQLLQALGCPASNRDPLAELSERLVARLVGGQLADSPVQKGYDVIGADGDKIQVTFLANPAGAWINEHHVKFTPDMDRYVVVFFDHLEPTFAIDFPKEGLAQVCQRLGKRHPNQDATLQLTRRNTKMIRQQREEFEKLGVCVYDIALTAPLA